MSKIEHVFNITILEFPPSINKLYFSLPHGGKAMSKEGVRFKNLVAELIQREWGPDLHKFDDTKPYLIRIQIFFPAILNSGWPKTASQKFKKRDIDNLSKLILDTISKAIGVDDANFLNLVIEKREDKENPRIVINVESIEVTGV